MKNQLASVIVPVFNRENLITRCLDSIAMQNYAPMEVIVVDNASTDSTRQRVLDWIASHDEDPGKTYRLMECPAPGAAAARDAGAREAAGEILFFFDSDDAMRQGYVGDAMREFALDPGLDIVGWRILFHNLDGSERKSHLWEAGNTMEAHLINAVLRTQGHASRRAFHLAAGGWNRNMPVWDDWELGFRLMLANPKVKVLDKIQADVYCQEESITGTSFTPKQGLWEAAIDSMERQLEESDHAKKERVRRILAYRRVILASSYRREGNKKQAGNLLGLAMGQQGISPLQRLILRLCYTYTSCGGRGAFRLFGRFL